MIGRSRIGRPNAIDLNLLPPELQRPAVARGTLILLLALAAGVLFFLATDRMRAQTWSRILDLEEKVTATKSLSRTENSRIAAEGAEAAKLEQEIKRLKDDMARYATNPPTQIRRLVPLTPIVDTALAGQSSGARIIAVSWQEPTLTLQGRAASVSAVMAYGEKMRDSKRFSVVDVRQITALSEKEKAAGRPGEEFVFVLELDVVMEGSR